MLGHVSRCTHSYMLWKVFDDLFRSQSKARAMSLRFQLQILKKGSSSIDDYFLQMKSVADALDSAGYSISDEDLVLHILGGIGIEFDAVVVSLTSRGEIPSLSEVQAILQTHEMRMAQASTTQNFAAMMPSPISNLTANFASKYGRIRGKPKFSKNKLICQICGKPNHTVAKCYKRFDAKYQGLKNTQPLIAQPRSFPSYSNTSPSYQAHLVHHIPGTSYSAPVPSPSSLSYSDNTSSSQCATGTGWIMDSGATHHITSQLGNLQIPTPYQGSELQQGSTERNS